MPDAEQIYRVSITLERLLPEIEAYINENPQSCSADWSQFKARLKQHFPTLFNHLYALYGSQYDFYYHLQKLMILMAENWKARTEDLKVLDQQREIEPHWYKSNQQVGAVCYVNLFANNLAGIQEKIPYFQQLGITYLHLMPLYECPKKENDGGYAVSSFRKVNPQLGTMEQLTSLATALRKAGISLALDLVFNHTSNEHEWAKQAVSGDQRYRNFYFIYDDRSVPDQYEQNLREIFPDEHPGAFTFLPEKNQWVWTTFHSYQWDLNYKNPDVFNAMAGEMLFLANAGTQIIRLDAVPFIWKEMGSSCENLPKAHTLIQAFNAVCRIAAPAMIFKSEAIVHPDDVQSYISLGECQISYNPLFMALLWNTLATREVNLLQQALYHRHTLPPGCAWVNYVRCHDDIGWTFADEDAAQLGINGYSHRQFLNSFYTGRFPGSFAAGLPFQENPKTGDARISGTTASLAGLEKAINQASPQEIELSIRRIVLLHGLTMTLGGIPLIYLGDEIGTLNDYQYRHDPEKAHDSRWVHRPQANPAKIAKIQEAGSIENQVFTRLRHLITIRKTNPVFSSSAIQVMKTENQHVLGFTKQYQQQHLVILANFSENEQVIPANILRLYGLGYRFEDRITTQSYDLSDIHLQPLQLMLLETKG